MKGSPWWLFSWKCFSVFGVWHGQAHHCFSRQDAFKQGQAEVTRWKKLLLKFTSRVRGQDNITSDLFFFAFGSSQFNSKFSANCMSLPWNVLLDIDWLDLIERPWRFNKSCEYSARRCSAEITQKPIYPINYWSVCYGWTNSFSLRSSKVVCSWEEINMSSISWWSYVT